MRRYYAGRWVALIDIGERGFRRVEDALKIVGSGDMHMVMKALNCVHVRGRWAYMLLSSRFIRLRIEVDKEGTITDTGATQQEEQDGGVGTSF